MSIALAAGGTGGHVIPALAVAEAIGDRAPLVFLGGDRFEATAVPEAGIELVTAQIRGLRRSLSPANLGIPRSVWRAVKTYQAAMEERGTRALLATGGYAAVPAGIAARRMGIPLFLHEQNAHAGLANRRMGRRAVKTYTSFPNTTGAVRPAYVGNPIKAAIATLDRPALHRAALDRYGLSPDRLTVGIVGGSLGSGPINAAMLSSAGALAAADAQVLHLTGSRFETEMRRQTSDAPVPWVVVGFEQEMQYFFAAVDLVVSRASGMVAELTATGTPSLLIPGVFGSKGHQQASAEFLGDAGAAVVVAEAALGTALEPTLTDLLSDPARRSDMAASARAIGKPDAAGVIAEEVLHAAG